MMRSKCSEGLIKLKAVFLLVTFLLTACNKEDIDYTRSRTSYFKNLHEQSFSDTTITCVTFNIQLGFKAAQDPWNKEIVGADTAQVKEIARLLKKAQPDIIALQEVPRNRYNAVVKLFIELLATEMDMNYAYGTHSYNDPYGIYPVHGEWGNAILTKYKILEINNKEVEFISKWEKRSILDASLELQPGKVLHAISLHYIPSDQAVSNTVKYLGQLSDPVIMMGDFNITGEIHAFDSLGFRDADANYTNNWIDRIYYSGNDFSCNSFGTIADSVTWISDHLANYGVLKLND
ncbi:MAG: endonuclease/exonuclease/phosphatase family protein [Bacteroidetes bacterium]|nr:endonuclease/exonuclease/phosphatase family protein [Bacteroidota bacterium]